MTVLGKYVTFGELVRQTNEREHIVRYILQRRDDIKPVARVGQANLYPAHAADVVAEELARRRQREGATA